MILPPPPNMHALAVMVLTVIALILFTREKIPLESSSLVILMGLAIGFELFPFQTAGGVLHAVDFFHGFGHEALVAVCALMIAGQGIVRTGALDPVGRSLARLWKVSPGLSLLLTLLVSAMISAFINNVPVVVLFLPILISVSLRTGMDGLFGSDAHGLRYPAGWNLHNHRHLHQSARGFRGRGDGPETLGNVRLPAAGNDCRQHRDRLSLASRTTNHPSKGAWR